MNSHVYFRLISTLVRVLHSKVIEKKRNQTEERGNLILFLQEHLNRYRKPGRGPISYHPSTICNEFIGLMCNEVLLRKLSISQYLWILHLIHMYDQLTFVLRNVDNYAIIREIFFEFIKLLRYEYLTLKEI